MKIGMGISFPIPEESKVEWFGRGSSRRRDEAKARKRIGLGE
jgi:hypothetical protein